MIQFIIDGLLKSLMVFLGLVIFAYVLFNNTILVKYYYHILFVFILITGFVWAYEKRGGADKKTKR